MRRKLRSWEDALVFEDIVSYILDDPEESGKKWAKVYITLPGLGDLRADRVRCDFSTKRLDLRVRGLRGGEGGERNVRLFCGELFGDIEPSKCKCTHKPGKDRLVLKLAKAEGRAWPKLKWGV